MRLLTSALATRLGLAFHIDGFWTAFVGTLVVSIRSNILGTILSWVVMPSGADND